MQKKRLKITQEMTQQVSSDYWRAEHQFTNIQQALQEDLVEKLSKNIGMTYVCYNDKNNDSCNGLFFILSTVDAMVTKGLTFVQLYFMTDDLPSAKEHAAWLSPQDQNLIRLFQRGEVSARELYMKLETDDYDLFVRRATIVLDMDKVIDIYNAEEAFIEKTDTGFDIE